MPLTRKKRGQVMWTMYIIITLAGFFITLTVVRHFATGTDQTQAEMLCRSSAAARARSLMNTDFLGVKVRVHISPLLCQTLDVDIEDGTSLEVMKILAEKMARCKWMFLDGIYNNVIGHTDGDLCFPCYTVKVNEITDRRVIRRAEFEDYLMNEKYKGNMTYMTYLTYYQGIPSIIRIVPEIQPKYIYQIQYSDFSRGKWYILGHEDHPNGINLIDPNDPPTTWYQRYQAVLGGSNTCIIEADLKGR